MRRKEFLSQLKRELNKTRDIEVEEVLFYYDELIQDAIDNGEEEDIFIANLGTVKQVRRKIEDEEDFIITVKDQNKAVRNALAVPVKILGYFIFGVIGFSLTVAAFSVAISGAGVIGAGAYRLIFAAPVDTYGYLAVVGIILIGIGLGVLGVAIIKWLFSESHTSLLVIFRKIKELFNKRG